MKSLGVQYNTQQKYNYYTIEFYTAGQNIKVETLHGYSNSAKINVFFDSVSIPKSCNNDYYK